MDNYSYETIFEFINLCEQMELKNVPRKNRNEVKRTLYKKNFLLIVWKKNK